MTDILGHVPVLIKSMTIDDERKITFEIPQSRHWYRNLRVKYIVKAKNGAWLYKGAAWRLPTIWPQTLGLLTRLRIWCRVQSTSERIITDPAPGSLEPLATIKKLRLTRNIASLLYLLIQIVWSMTNAKAVGYIWQTAWKRQVLTAAIKELDLAGNTLIGLRSLLKVIMSFGDAFSFFMLVGGTFLVFFSIAIWPVSSKRMRRSDRERYILRNLLVFPMQILLACSLLPVLLIGSVSLRFPSLIAPLVNVWLPITLILGYVRPKVRAYMYCTDHVANDRSFKEAAHKDQ